MSFSDENSDEDQTLVVRKEKKETRVNPMIQRVIRGLFIYFFIIYIFLTRVCRELFFFSVLITVYLNVHWKRQVCIQNQLVQS